MRIIDVGLREYDEVHELQKRLHSEVVSNPHNSYLILCEHTTVIKIGRFGDRKNIVDERVKVRRIERGGDVTLHNPGQLVGYLIRRVNSIKEFVFGIEELLLNVLRRFEISAFRKNGFIGIWTSRGKIASIGVAVRKAVSFHGFALNVCNDLNEFSMLNPCGIKGCVMTSVSHELGRNVPISAVKEYLKEIAASNANYAIYPPASH